MTLVLDVFSKLTEQNKVSSTHQFYSKIIAEYMHLRTPIIKSEISKQSQHATDILPKFESFQEIMKAFDNMKELHGLLECVDLTARGISLSHKIQTRELFLVSSELSEGLNTNLR